MLIQSLESKNRFACVCGGFFPKFPLSCKFSICSLSPIKDSCQKPACYEKTVTLSKEPYDSLGMTVAGGMSSRGWDLPVYVTNVDPDGVVGKEGSIRKGNQLLDPFRYQPEVMILQLQGYCSCLVYCTRNIMSWEHN